MSMNGGRTPEPCGICGRKTAYFSDEHQMFLCGVVACRSGGTKPRPELRDPENPDRPPIKLNRKMRRQLEKAKRKGK